MLLFLQAKALSVFTKSEPCRYCQSKCKLHILHAVGLTPRQNDVLLSRQPYSPSNASQRGSALPVSSSMVRSSPVEDPPLNISGRAQAFQSTATRDDMTQKQAFDNPVSLEASASGEWPLNASMDRKKLRRISSALKDLPASPQSPSVKQWLPGDEEEIQRQALSHLPPRQAPTERRPGNVQPRSPSRHSATAGAGPVALSATAGPGPPKHSATAGAGSVAADRLTAGGGNANEAEAQRKVRQQAVDQLKAMLQSDPRVIRRESSDGGWRFYRLNCSGFAIHIFVSCDCCGECLVVLTGQAQMLSA